MSRNGTLHRSDDAARRPAPAEPGRWNLPATPARRGLWPGVVFALLGLNVCIVAITVFAATRGRAATIEPNYYERAVHWDDAAREQERARLLGWTVDTRLAPAPAGPGSELVVVPRDRAGAPVQAAEVHASLFHHAHAGDVTEAALAPDPSGAYRAIVPAASPGLWRIQLSIVKGEERWSRAIDLDFAPGRGAAACSR